MATINRSSHVVDRHSQRAREDTQIVIRHASAGDLIGLRKLQRRCFPDGQSWGFVTLAVFQLLPRSPVLVARRGDDVVGCVIGDVQKDQARVLNICVDPDYRRLGLGSALLSSIERCLNHHNVTLMVEDKNIVAQALYRQHGYLPAGDLRDYYGRNRHGVLMQKRRVPQPTGYHPPITVTNGRGEER